MKILGFDPGTRFCGYCLLEKNGSINTLLEAGLIRFKSKELIDNILELNEALEMIFEKVPNASVAVENIFFAYNPQSVLKLAQFRGAMLLKILQTYGNFSEYTALQVKKTITGKAKAEKEQVAFMVKKLLKINKEIKPLDITDAMAVALTHSFSIKEKI
ncbi:crossover junction endodeoxyribonuclease RuvC [Campylobacter sp. MG1]|uniref:crossover junction endodeoxyribonuclease RuvC n=1 Tax=Campylobacter sp. MG1 TaxID=2976332 RepID=UPI00226CAA54|nr:crossover junction endodeoxyribonuclease RuvC [Campylobacter sp. MG1]